MSATDTTPDHRAGGDVPPHEIDRMLTSYFQSQLPSPWPVLKAPASARPAPFARRDGLAYSRCVLAASLASLLVGGWLLTGKLLGPLSPGASVHDGTATVPREMRPDTTPRNR